MNKPNITPQKPGVKKDDKQNGKPKKSGNPKNKKNQGKNKNGKRPNEDDDSKGNSQLAKILKAIKEDRDK